jgi:hypothetical protein
LLIDAISETIDFRTSAFVTPALATLIEYAAVTADCALLAVLIEGTAITAW